MAPRKRARHDSNAPEISRPLEIKATMEADSFREELVNMWREGRLCDVTIEVEGRSFRVTFRFQGFQVVRNFGV